MGESGAVIKNISSFYSVYFSQLKIQITFQIIENKIKNDKE
jgi:hypothetical protein